MQQAGNLRYCRQGNLSNCRLVNLRYCRQGNVSYCVQVNLTRVKLEHDGSLKTYFLEYLFIVFDASFCNTEFLSKQNQYCYNLSQLISRFSCLYLKESKFSKWQDGNVTNNLTILLLILFIL
jgi:hypothetical protein